MLPYWMNTRGFKDVSRLRCLIKAVLILFFFTTGTAFATKVIELNIKGAIGPASANYLIRNIQENQKADLILIKIDTPGGLYKSTRDIIQAFLSSKIPIITYVTPSGARAASAGTFLLYASTIAAMAPGTHLGAASPVSLTGASPGKGAEKSAKSTMEKKVANDAIAYIRSLAQLRERNIEFAEKAILEAATMTANEALKNDVINIIAKDRKDLFKQLDNITVMQDGRQITLHTQEVSVEKIEPDWRMEFLLIITNPTVAYLLLLLGIYGIFFELINPGFMLPGVIGAIAMLTALYALQLLPINYAGLGLIILGIAFMIAEAFDPSFGVLGIGGVVAFIIGSVLLIDTEHQDYQIAWSAIWAMAAVNVLFFSAVFSMVLRSRWQPSRHGTRVLVGNEGRAISDIKLQGQAKINGEIWMVKASKPVNAGSKIKVTGSDGLTLDVEEIF